MRLFQFSVSISSPKKKNNKFRNILMLVFLPDDDYLLNSVFYILISSFLVLP